MDQTSKARGELDRLGRSLRAELIALITDLTIRVHLRRLSLDEPKVADPREPLRYHYATIYQGNRPATVTAAETASRATSLLRAAGWDVTASQEDDDGILWTVIVAHRDGSDIRILTSEDTPVVSFRGQTAVVALRPPQPVQQPEPVRTAETVTPGYVLCYECEGLGWCPRCAGRGWTFAGSQRKSRCNECHARKVCPICRGQGELSASDLSQYQRGHYPELE
ncbi:hypothetical protein ACIQWN_24005 [Streptomyces vinaceus]|uniref:hypothetical protein n=1 Tax=Streptomyces vinaceus TaxID=1960 RepID=UPI0038175710